MTPSTKLLGLSTIKHVESHVSESFGPNKSSSTHTGSILVEYQSMTPPVAASNAVERFEHAMDCEDDHKSVLFRNLVRYDCIEDTYGFAVSNFCKSVSTGSFFSTRERRETLRALEKFRKSSNLGDHQSEFWSIWDCFGLRYQKDHTILQLWLQASRNHYSVDRFFRLLVDLYAESTPKTHRIIGNTLLQLWPSQRRLNMSRQKRLSLKLAQIFVSRHQQSRYVLPLILKLFDHRSMEIVLLRSINRKPIRNIIRNLLSLSVVDLKLGTFIKCLQKMTPLACWELKSTLGGINFQGLLEESPLIAYIKTITSVCRNLRRYAENKSSYLQGLSVEQVRLIKQVLTYDFDRFNTENSHFNEHCLSHHETQWIWLLNSFARDLKNRTACSRQLLLILDTIIALRYLTISKNYPFCGIAKSLEAQLDIHVASHSIDDPKSLEKRSIAYTFFVLINQSERFFLSCNSETLVGVLLIQNASNVEASARFQNVAIVRPHVLALYCYDTRFKKSLPLLHTDSYTHSEWVYVFLHLLRLCTTVMDQETIERALSSLCDIFAFQTSILFLFMEAAHRIISERLRFSQTVTRIPEEVNIDKAANIMIQYLTACPENQLSMEDNQSELATIVSQVLQAQDMFRALGQPVNS